MKLPTTLVAIRYPIIIIAIEMQINVERVFLPSTFLLSHCSHCCCYLLLLLSRTYPGECYFLSEIKSNFNTTFSDRRFSYTLCGTRSRSALLTRLLFRTRDLCSIQVVNNNPVATFATFYGYTSHFPFTLTTVLLDEILEISKTLNSSSRSVGWVVKSKPSLESISEFPFPC